VSDTYDLIVIGGGTGGYPAAIRAAQLGMKVACVDRRETLGGTCLNVGCIPSKALLHSTEIYREVSSGLEEHGIGIAGVSLNLAQLLARKDKVVADLTKGIEFLFKKNKVDWVKGSARFKDAGTLTVELNDGGIRELSAAKGIIVATGSDVATLAGVAIDEKRIVSSTGALALSEVPKHLAVIGGGYIGLELGSVWRRLGAEVTVIEYFDRIVPAVDGEIAAQLHKVLSTQGLAFRLGTKVTRVERRDGGVTLDVEPASGGASETIEADVVLLAIGRRPYTEGLGLEELSVMRDDKGRIPVDERFRTNVEGVYAIGDVVPGPMLAHKTTEDGIACVEGIAGQYARVDYNKIPSVIYTWPELASVGKTEEELKAAGANYKVGKFPFSANSRARVNGDTTGFVKILTDGRTDTVLGVHIIGPDAGTMIPEAVLALEFGASAEDIALTVHAHPTLPEAIREAALAARGQAMHI
jgi:dihydrolipoamide dehydrogenase